MRGKINHVRWLLCVLFLTWPAQAQYSGGTGEPDDPYQIATAGDLILLGENPDDYDKHFILTADIDLDPNLPGRKVFDRAVIAPDTNDMEDWFQGTGFKGILDGSSHTISHLTITGKSFLGLFGKLASGATVSKLNLEAVDVNGTGENVGGLVGYNDNGNITNSYSIGTVSGDGYVGGLVGRNSGSITTSYSTGTVTGNDDVGGLVGRNNGNITTSYSTGMVTGNDYVGGLVGRNSGSITTSYSTGTVSGNYSVGGLVGYNRYANITSSFWDVETSGLTVSDGGVGLTTAEMMDPYMLGLNGFANDPNWILDTGRDYPRLAWEGTAGQIIPEPIIDWLDGQGTEEEPYRVDIADQLILLGRASTLGDKYFILGADINLDPNLQGRKVFSQAVIQVFSGVFDGNDHTISHLTILGESYLGLFGKLASGATVSNLDLEAVDVNGTGDYVSGLVGRNSGNITTSYSTGTVTGNDYVGGLVGRNNGSITTSYSTGTVGGYRRVGGLVGYSGGKITTSYSTGAVNGKYSVGGLVGCNHKANITNSYSIGTVSGTGRYVGGLVGENRYASITSSFWDVETSGLSSSDGGIGKTTAEMQTAGTFLAAGWDFVDETFNGTEDIWWILDRQDYPRLWWETTEDLLLDK